MIRNAMQTQEQERELVNTWKIDSITQRSVHKKENAVNKIREKKIISKAHD